MFMLFFPEPTSTDGSGLSFQIGDVFVFGMSGYFVTGVSLGTAPHSMSFETIDLASATARIMVSSTCHTTSVDRFRTRAGRSLSNLCNNCANLASTLCAKRSLFQP